MKTSLFFAFCLGCLLVGSERSHAQDGPRFTGIQRITSNDTLLQVNAGAGVNYRIEASTNLLDWIALITVLSTGSNQFTNSTVPSSESRFFRAVQLSGSTNLTGDHFATTNGDVVVHPLFHASFVMSWNGKTIYNDPDDDAAYQSRYQGLPPADLILVSHSHGDHFSSAKIEAVRGPNAIIIAPQAVYNGLTASQKTSAIILRNGQSTNVLGLSVEAVPAYNANHPRGDGNGYVVTIGGKRFYMSGDTGSTPEMRALADIDVAFLCMNMPFTMSLNDAVTAIRAFRPKVIYPYHYRNQDSTLTDLNSLKKQIGTEIGVEVRARRWYQ